MEGEVRGLLQLIADSLDYVMNATFFSAITLCLLLYARYKSKRWLAVGTYFLLQVILELIIRATEVHNPLTAWFNLVFGEMTAVKGLFYSALLFDMVLVVCYMLDEKPKPIYFLSPSLICLFLIGISMMQEKNMIFYGVFFVPCELFYIGWSIFGLRKIRQKENSDSYAVFRIVLILMIVSTVIILAEDFYASWYYGLYNTFVGCTEPVSPHAYIKARSYSESLLQIVLACFAIQHSGRLLLSRLHATPCTTADDSLNQPVPEPAEPSSAEKRRCFAEELGLSARETEVLPMLLDNYSMQEISSALSISPGTVKYHTHNIYQKAGVGDRVELILKFDLF